MEGLLSGFLVRGEVWVCKVEFGVALCRCSES